jgi:hypothetical protein
MSNDVGANLHSSLRDQQQCRPSSPLWTVTVSSEGADVPVTEAMAVAPATAKNSPATSSRVIARRRFIVDLPCVSDNYSHL